MAPLSDEYLFVDITNKVKLSLFFDYCLVSILDIIFFFLFFLNSLISIVSILCSGPILVAAKLLWC